MTIRDYLIKRSRQFYAAMVISWLFIIGGILFQPGPISDIAVGVGIIGFMLSLVLNMMGVKCPRCSTNLAQVTAIHKQGKTNFCPNCGISFDDAMND